MSTRWSQPPLTEALGAFVEAMRSEESKRFSGGHRAPLALDITVTDIDAIQYELFGDMALPETSVAINTSDFDYSGESIADLAEEASLVLEQIKAIEDGEPLYFESEEFGLDVREGEAYFHSAGYELTTESDSDSDESLRFMVDYLRSLVGNISKKMEEREYDQ